MARGALAYQCVAGMVPAESMERVMKSSEIERRYEEAHKKVQAVKGDAKGGSPYQRLSALLGKDRILDEVVEAELERIEGSMMFRGW